MVEPTRTSAHRSGADPASAGRHPDPNRGSGLTPELAQLIEELRADLAENMPATLGYAQFGDAALGDGVPAELPAGLQEFLRVVDGLRAGRFELASTTALGRIQHHLDYAPAFSPIPGDKADWLVIGTRSDEPLFMAHATGSIWYFPPTGTEWYMGDTFEEIAPDLDSFVHYYLLGPGYAELAANDDRWYAFLDQQGLLDEADDAELLLRLQLPNAASPSN